jgi:hypothetical protein
MTRSAPSAHLSTSLAAHPGHLSAERLGLLHRQAAHPARCADDQHALPGLERAGVERTLGGQPGHADHRRLFEAQI